MVLPFNKLYTMLKVELDKIKVPLTSSYQSELSKFPSVVMSEISNTTNFQTLDTSGEYAIDYSFEINIYSNSTKPKSEVDKIMQVVDNVFSVQLSCNRDSSNQIPNMMDNKIFRQVVRYSCVIDKNLTVYRR